MGSLSDLFLKYGHLLETAFDIDDAGNLIEKDASKVLEADSLFHDIFVSDVRAILKELAFDPHAPQHVNTVNPAMWSQEYPSWLAPYTGQSASQVSPQPPMVGTPRQAGELQPNRVVTKVRTSRPDLVHGNGSGPQATGTGPAYGTPRQGSPAFDPNAPAGGGTAPAAGAPASMAGNSFAQKAPGIMGNLMRDFGLKDYQAAAIVGNLGHESGGFKYHQELNPRGGGRGGIGWAQWTGPRRVDYENYSKQNGLDPRSDAANYGFLKQEIQNKYGNALEGLKQTGNAEQAMRHWEGAYEGSGVKNYPSRLNYTNMALDHYNRSQNPQTAQDPSQQTQTANNGLARYATGNAVSGGPSSVDGTHPEFANRINRMVADMPPDLAKQFQISSGVRDQERERQVYQTQHPGQAIPKDSYHNHGMAVDINRNPAVQDWINQNGANYGVGFTISHIPGEDNHLEPTENGQRIPQRQVQAWSQQNMPRDNRTQVAQNPQADPQATRVASTNPNQPLPGGQTQRPLAIGDSLAVGVGGVYGNTRYAAGGWNPQRVDTLVDKAIADGSVNGRPIVLSGGASNAGGNSQMVQQYYPQMIKKLQDAGASSVHVMGVGPYSHYDNYGYNDIINKSTQDAGVHFTGPLANIAKFNGTDLSGGVHPNDYHPIADHVNQQIQQMQQPKPPQNVAQATPQPTPAAQPEKPLAGSPQDVQAAVSKTAAATPPPPPSTPTPTPTPTPSQAPPPQTPPPQTTTPPPEEKVAQLSSAHRAIRPSHVKLAERHTRTAIGLLRGI